MSRRHSCYDWKGQFSRTCIRVIHVTTSCKQIHLWCFYYLTHFPEDVSIYSAFAKMPGLPRFLVYLCIHWPELVFCCNSGFSFQRMLSNFFAIFWVLLHRIFITYDRVIMLSMWMWTNIPFSFNVNVITLDWSWMLNEQKGWVGIRKVFLHFAKMSKS